MKLKPTPYLCSAFFLTIFLISGAPANAATTVLAGSQFTFDGVDGPLVASAIVPDNLALASNGSLPIAIDAGHAPTHSVAGLNNGLYGNNASWIGHTGRDIDIGGGEIVHTAFAGIAFAGTAVLQCPMTLDRNMAMLMMLNTSART